MVSKVQRWGNSQGLRLPKHILERADISVGDDVEIISENDSIIIRKAHKPKFDLADMVSRMPRNYKVKEDSFGGPVGKEEW